MRSSSMIFSIAAVALVGCGVPDHNLVTVDVTSDGNTPGLASLYVHDAGGAMVSVTSFRLPSRELVDVSAGDSVTLVVPQGDPARFTVFDVKPWEELQLRATWPALGPPPPASAPGTFVSFEPSPTGASYMVDAWDLHIPVVGEDFAEIVDDGRGARAGDFPIVISSLDADRQVTGYAVATGRFGQSVEASAFAAPWWGRVEITDPAPLDRIEVGASAVARGNVTTYATAFSVRDAALPMVPLVGYQQFLYVALRGTGPAPAAAWFGFAGVPSAHRIDDGRRASRPIGAAMVDGTLVWTLADVRDTTAGYYAVANGGSWRAIIPPGLRTVGWPRIPDLEPATSIDGFFAYANDGVADYDAWKAQPGLWAPRGTEDVEIEQAPGLYFGAADVLEYR